MVLLEMPSLLVALLYGTKEDWQVQYVDETCWKIACKNGGVDAGLIETILKL